MVKLTVSLLTALAALPAAFAQTYTVTYDTTYDNAGQSLDTVACSDGQYGLEPEYSTFGGLPDFPYIGGAFAVAGWDSPNCGTCWQLTYNGNSINILAIDTAPNGFNIAEEAFIALVGSTFSGFVSAEAVQVDASVCGL